MYQICKISQIAQKEFIRIYHQFRFHFQIQKEFDFFSELFRKIIFFVSEKNEF